MKQRLVSVARAAGLLPAFDAMRFMRSKWASAEANARFREAHPDFDPPPLWWTHVSTERPRVADWGCGLARVLRHLPARYERTGFDYNALAIEWCTDHVNEARFFHNGLMPPLPASAASFDALYALSVFTHLSEKAHDAWIHDIARVLAPGGVFLGAFHTKLARDQLLPEEQARFDAGKLVVRGRVKEGSRTYVAYHPESWLRHHLFHGWEILEGPVDFFGQSLFVARRP